MYFTITFSLWNDIKKMINAVLPVSSTKEEWYFELLPIICVEIHSPSRSRFLPEEKCW